MQKRMIHAGRLAMLGELATGIAHEVQNPLDGLQECVRYLEVDPEKSARAEKYLPILKTGLDRISAILSRMLVFARSAHETVVETCSVSEIVDSVLLLVEARLQTQNVHVTWNVPGPCLCLANRWGLSQVMLNLLMNAMEATRDTANAEIVIDVDREQEWMLVGVEDNGSGMPEEVSKKIFEPFFTTKPLDRGTGLGLSVSRQLIRAVGGELELSQRPSRLGGARFVLRVQSVADGEDIGE